MKKLKNLLLSFSLILIFINGINVYAKSEADDPVSVRELAILASLAYEPAPDNTLYENVNDGISCTFNSDGKLLNTCSFIYDNVTKVTWRGTKYEVFRNIEGMSKRKLNLLTFFLTQKEEAGSQYYFMNSVNYNELDDWTVVDTIKKVNATDSQTGTGIYALTFKRGDNYVIAYRGTDFPDILEWLDDLVVFGSRSETTENEEAIEYAQNQYKKIIAENPNAKIYITGHSLGAYLAQVAGAAIADLGKENPTVKTTQDISTFEDYKNIYCKKTNALGKCYSSNLVQVAYFNGMGLSALYSKINRDYVKNLSNGLVFLSTFSQDGIKMTKANISSKINLLEGNTNVKTVNYSVEENNPVYSSGRVVLYSMKGDIVSSIGLHFGEIIRFEAGEAAIKNHKGNHLIKSEAISSANAAVVEGLDNVNEEIKTKLQNLIAFINESLENLKVKYQTEAEKKLAEGLSEALSNIISVSDDTSEELDANLVPKAVLNVVNRETNLQIVTNLLSSLKKASETYNVGSIIEAANIGHETDSFACLLDSENGKPEVKLTVSGPTTGDNSANDTIYLSKNSNVSATITATVSNGCVKKYQWKVCNSDGTGCEDIGKDSSTITFNNTIDQSYNGKAIKLVATYGNYYGTWTLDSSSNDFDYKDNELLDEEYYVETDLVPIIIDNEKPTCFLPDSDISFVKTCVKKGLFGICKKYETTPNSVTYWLDCSDNISTKLYYNTKIKETSNGLFTDHIVINNQQNYLDIIPKVTDSRVKVKMSSTVCDRVSNCISVDRTLLISYTKN